MAVHLECKDMKTIRTISQSLMKICKAYLPVYKTRQTRASLAHQAMLTPANGSKGGQKSGSIQQRIALASGGGGGGPSFRRATLSITGESGSGGGKISGQHPSP